MQKSTVVVIDTDYQNIASDIEKLFADFTFDFKGKKVFLKPNILLAATPERGITTHPHIINAVVRYLFEKGAQVSVGDNSGMRIAYGNNEGVARVAGIYDAACGTYKNIASHGIRVKTGLAAYPEVTISREVFACDVFISMPKFKTHLNTIISGAVKNSYGLIVGAEKLRLHALYPDYDRFAEVVVRIFKTRPPDFVIMDAVIGMEGDGPTSQRLRSINKVIVSTDAAAVDTAMCFMMGIPVDSVALMRHARQQNIGATSLHNIEVIGRLEHVPNFVVPVTYKKPNAKDSFLNRAFNTFVSKTKLRIVEKKCVRCLQCRDTCPVGAVYLTKQKYPRIDRRRCIACFCCKEICPHNAIEITGALGVLQNVLK